VAVGSANATTSAALRSNTTGSFNSAFGVGALGANTTASNNTAVGYSAMRDNTTGAGNAAFGRFALIQNTTASNNAAIGQGSMFSNTTGANNTGVGTDALTNNTTASNNTAVGYRALYTSNSLNNTAVGYSAGYSLSSGEKNTIMGLNAGYYLTTGSRNTFIGTQNSNGASGWEITTGSANTILGGYTGNNGGLDIRTASNYVVLADGDGNLRGYANSSGIWNFAGGIKCTQITLATSTTGTVTVPNGCVCTMSGDGYFEDALMFSLKAQGGSQGCYIMSRGGSAGAWGIGTTSNPSTGSRGNIWVSATNTLSIQNTAGSTITFYFTFLSTS
jgi:hypothetical protein